MIARKLCRAIGAITLCLAPFTAMAADTQTNDTNHGESSMGATPYHQHDVQFPSDNATCAGLLYLPTYANAGQPVPAVVLAPGLGSLKEMGLTPFAQALAAQGIASLIFDFRHWGESGGAPREQIDPAGQLDDYRHALSYLALREDIDGERLGVMGVSFSGGHVLQVAAIDQRVKAVASVMPATDLYALSHAQGTPEQIAGRYRAFARERERLYASGEHRYIPLAMPRREGNALMGTETYEWQKTMQERFAPHFVNRVSLDSLDRIYNYSPALMIHRIAPTPLLMVLGTDDQIVPPEFIRQAFTRAGEPKKLLELNTGHYGIYQGRFQQEAMRATVAWFNRHL